MKYIKILLVLSVLIGCDKAEQEMSLDNFTTTVPTSGDATGTKFRTAAFNIYLNFGVTAKRDAINRHVDRVSADYLTLTETSSADYAYVQANYTAKGYTDFYRGTGAGNFDLMFCSKTPIVYSETIVMSGRNPIYNEVEVDGKRVGIVSHHNASWCLNTPCNQFPTELPQEAQAHDRTVQLYIVLKFLQDRKAFLLSDQGINVSFVIQGDWNDDTTHTQIATYTDLNKPSGAMTLPAGITYPLNNAPFPLQPLADVKGYNGNMTLIIAQDLAGSPFTIWDNVPNPGLTLAMTMDYVAFSDDIRLVDSEVINSEVDNATDGITKFGSVLNPGDSRLASDHKMVVADLRI